VKTKVTKLDVVKIRLHCSDFTVIADEIFLHDSVVMDTTTATTIAMNWTVALQRSSDVMMVDTFLCHVKQTLNLSSAQSVQKNAIDLF